MPSLVTCYGDSVVRMLWSKYPYWTAAKLVGFLYLYLEGRDDLRRNIRREKWNYRLYELNQAGLNPETVEIRYGVGFVGEVSRKVARNGSLLFSGRIFGM